MRGKVWGERWCDVRVAYEGKSLGERWSDVRVAV